MVLVGFSRHFVLETSFAAMLGHPNLCNRQSSVQILYSIHLWRNKETTLRYCRCHETQDLNSHLAKLVWKRISRSLVCIFVGCFVLVFCIFCIWSDGEKIAADRGATLGHPAFPPSSHDFRSSPPATFRSQSLPKTLHL